ncbi:MAG TPA: hypothetical protein VKI61_07550 [Chitinophagaceae bacterium]|nr:hypothetical protein [Chitinophagaceae bacterium]
MHLMLKTGVNLFFIGTMVFSLAIIIVSIRWIRDLYKIKRKTK